MATQGVLRRYTFKLYPNAAQAAALDAIRRLHCTLYNAALQERIDAYRLAGKSLTHFDQSRSVKTIRADDPAYAAIAADSLSFTLKRLDMAYQAFYRRAKQGAGRQSGFPRYKRGDDYPGFTHRPGQGWKFDIRPGARSGRTTFKGVPEGVRWRGEFPMFPYAIKTGDVMLRAGTWWLSIVADVPARMRADAADTGEVVFDLLDSFARVSRVNSGQAAGPEEAVYAVVNGRIIPSFLGGYAVAPGVPPEMGGGLGFREAPQGEAQPAVPPDMGGGLGDCGICVGGPAVPPDMGGGLGARLRHRPAEKPAVTPDMGGGLGFLLKLKQRSVPSVPPDTGGGLGESVKRGSCRYRENRLRAARKSARVARQRREALHLWTTHLVRQFALLKITAPPLVEATRSGRGNEYEHGAEVALKARLNRRVLDQAPGFAIAMLRYKIAERGGSTETIVAAEATPVMVGNLIVAARKVTRKLKRTANARRSGKLHPNSKSLSRPAA